ncbi:TPA: peptide chain release factor N(5)-glutamine methyltransferase [Candidatus Dependentiae bacterium]|nr:MAG: Release factor glutamine methyltransferase [candidate division TM6 bacterium GW2011_GWE2_31_21]KKP53197.1 MAG: Release factor glutamine methyltransferase [candidate division TM6 bacterium GW2011_GWF2_33_332]HBS48015.1 peptide chain release factor N(5)-glutamine methyltransferase [Candidatus Dependentiae bacterium]HBZ73381.1 peptide chain release factor N(5)-glutamine methyltransferase [Candidatus Dependentiae bacterium]
MEIKVLDLIKKISSQLIMICKNETLATQEAWWLLEKLLEKTQTQLLVQEKVILHKSQNEILQKWVERRLKDKEPIQYILGSVPFCSVQIQVAPPVLIPRPETEEWTSWIIEKLKTIKDKNLTILDLCCGSGCIALAIAKEFPNFKIFGSDINPKAIELSIKNKIYNKTENAEFVQSNLFEYFKNKNIKFDLIVSNPPYISQTEWATLSEEVKTWEDINALVAPENGLEIYKKIAKEAIYYLKTESKLKSKLIPQLIVEIGQNQGISVKNIFINTKASVSVHKDIEDKDRWISVSFP